MNKLLLGAALAALALAGPLGPVSKPARAAEPARPCTPEGGLQFVCGITIPEDMVTMPGTGWIITGSMGLDGTGGLYRLDTRGRDLQRFYPDGPTRLDAKTYPDCATPPDRNKFSAHGLSIRARPGGKANLYVVGHGGREAIEAFELSAAGGKLTATWVGCVLAPKGASFNSVVGLANGDILTTSIVNEPSTFQDILAGKPTGYVYARTPGQPFKPLPNTHVSGDNGIEVSRDGKRLFVAATGDRKLYRYERADMNAKPAVVDLDIMADNLRYAPDGRLLVAGEKPGAGCGQPQCPGTYSVIAVDPVTLKTETLAKGVATKSFGGVSSGLIAGGRVWLAAHQGDRIAYQPLKR